MCLRPRYPLNGVFFRNIDLHHRFSFCYSFNYIVGKWRIKRKHCIRFPFSKRNCIISRSVYSHDMAHSATQIIYEELLEEKKEVKSRRSLTLRETN